MATREELLELARKQAEQRQQENRRQSLIENARQQSQSNDETEEGGWTAYFDGWGDNLAALGLGGLDGATAGGSDFVLDRTSANDSVDRIREDNPYFYLAGQALGSIPTFLAGYGLVARGAQAAGKTGQFLSRFAAPTLKSRVYAGTLGGGAYEGVRSSFENEGAPDPNDILIGMGLGGAGGAAAHGLARFIGSNKSIGTTQNRVEAKHARRNPEDVSDYNSLTRNQAETVPFVKSSDVLDAVEKSARVNLQPTGETTDALRRQAIDNASPSQATKTINTLIKRNDYELDRARNDLKKIFNKGEKPALKHADATKRAYEEAYATKLPSSRDPDIKRLRELANQTPDEPLNYASSILRTTGDTTNLLSKVRSGKPLSVKELDYISRGLRAAREERLNTLGASETDLTRSYEGLAKQIRQTLSAKVPKFREAARLARDHIQDKEFYRAGKDVLKPGTRTERIQELVEGPINPVTGARENGATPSQIRKMQQGVSDELDELINNAKSTIKGADVDAQQQSKLYNLLSSPNALYKLELIFKENIDDVLVRLREAARQQAELAKDTRRVENKVAKNTFNIDQNISPFEDAVGLDDVAAAATGTPSPSLIGRGLRRLGNTLNFEDPRVAQATQRQNLADRILQRESIFPEINFPGANPSANSVGSTVLNNIQARQESIYEELLRKLGRRSFGINLALGQTISGSDLLTGNLDRNNR